MIGSEYLTTLVSLSDNLAVLTCGIAAYCWVRRCVGRKDTWARAVGEALILSALALYAMNNSLYNAPGRLYDARFVILMLAGLVSGPGVAFVVLAATVIMRVVIGGVGMPQGVFDSIAVFCLACAYGRWLRQRARTVGYRDFAILGVLISLITFLGWFLLLPWELVRRNLANVEFTLALMSGNEVGILILGTLIILDHRLKVLERGLADRGAKFRDVIDHLPASLAMRDRHGNLQLLNRTFRERYGDEVMGFIGRNWDELRRHLYSGERYEESIADERAVIASGEPATRFMTGVKTLQGDLTLMLTVFNAPDARGRPDSMAIIGVDISELRRRERENERLREQLINVGKMKAIGQLAGGIAHDFNNLLGAMFGFASFLDEDLEQRPEDREHAKRILILLDHAKNLVSQILTFARADRVEREPTEVSQLVRGTVYLAQIIIAGLRPADARHYRRRGLAQRQ